MKRGMVIALVLAAVWMGTARESEPLPDPIGDKPVLIAPAKQWPLTGAYYRKVKMPDGSVQELKSRTALTDTQWQAFAESIYQKPEPERVCPTCGQRWEGGIIP